MFTLEIIILVLNVIAIGFYLFQSVKKIVYVSNLGAAVERNWGSGVELKWEVKRVISDYIDRYIAKELTEEKLKEIVLEVGDSFRASSVAELTERAKEHLKDQLVTEVKEKKLSEVLALLDTKAIANALTLTAASEIMQRMPQNRTEYR